MPMKKTTDHAAYEPPRLEAERVSIESGFSGSVGMDGVGVGDWNDGGLLGGGEAEEVIF